MDYDADPDSLDRLFNCETITDIADERASDRVPLVMAKTSAIKTDTKAIIAPYSVMPCPFWLRLFLF